MTTFRVALASLKGGTGRTTLTANLSAIAAQAGRRSAAMDLDVQNGLSHHFAPGAVAAVGVADTRASAVRRRGGRDSGEAACVPFSCGTTSVDCEAMPSSMDWLARRLQEVEPPQCELAFLDTPAYPGPWLHRALAVADLVLVVLVPEPGCFATLPQTLRLLDEARGEGRPGVGFVVNQHDGSSPLCRDVLAAIRGALGDKVAPAIVRHDTAVREAVARHRTMAAEATDSQVLADLGELCDWIVAAADRQRATGRAGRTGA